MSFPPARRLHADWTIAALALAALLAWDATGLDLVVMRHIGSAAGFALRDHWVTRVVLHEGGRLVGWMMMALLIVNLWRPIGPRLPREQRWHWLAVTLLCLLVVPALKRISTTSCPWDLAEFGGAATYLSHWQWGSTDGGSGHCFPSGHAASAFGFLWGWFALRDTHPRLARAWLALVLALGVLSGLVQCLRGAHYPSHALWTAWLCWAICTAASNLQALQRTLRADTAATSLPAATPRPAAEDGA